MKPESIVTDPTKLAELPFVIFELAVEFVTVIVGLSFSFTEQILRVMI